MPNPQEFYFLHVDVSASALEQYAERVTAKGRDSGGTFTPHGILQVCILLSPPFQTAQDHEVLDIRPKIPKVKQLRRARDRPMLVETLADALFDFEQYFCSLGQKLHDIHADAAAVLETMKLMVQVFEFLRARGKLPPSLRHVRNRDVQDAYQILATVHQGLTRKDYLRRAWLRELQPHLFRDHLTRRLHQSFTRYGPPKYPADAIYYAVAAILLHVEIECSTEPRLIAARLRKRRERVQL